MCIFVQLCFKFYPEQDLNSIFMSRYVSSELATDIVIIVGDVKFYLHKV